MNFHRFIRDGNGWELLRSEPQFANPFLEVYRVSARTPSRPEGVEWTVAHRKGAAVVVPMTHDGQLLMVRQERVPVRTTLWEFPAGQIEENAEQNNESIRAAALRELREESGWELAHGGELIPLGYFFPSAGFTDEHSHLFLARPVVPSAQGPEYDANEAITECRAFSPEEFRAMIASGEIRDANTLSAFARMVAMGLW